MNYCPTFSDRRARAFLRWAGGKSWLVPRLKSTFGELSFKRYHEPFLGGGSFFFAVGGGSNAFLSDKNEALIETYESIKSDPERVIAFMRDMQNNEKYYYDIRDSAFECPFQRSAQFIYLNQTSFNGIYRVNLRGVYNVPYGHRTKAFLDAEGLRAASRALQNATLKACDFQDTAKGVEEGDLVFVDPPYTVSHNNNGFIKYNKALFALADQHRLFEYLKAIRDKGAYYILTNAAHPAISEIFKLDGNQVEVSRASLIGGKNAQRGAVSEYLFTNLEIQRNDDPQR